MHQHKFNNTDFSLERERITNMSMASGWNPNFSNGYNPNNQNLQSSTQNSHHQNVNLSGGYGSGGSSYPSTGNMQQHYPHQQQQQHQAYYPPQHTTGYQTQCSSDSHQSGGQQQRSQKRPGDWDWEEIVEEEFRKEIGKMATEAQQKPKEKK